MSSNAASTFETVFSNGLDLSEFTSFPKQDHHDSPPTMNSASAELLRVKTIEASRKEIEAIEETIMQQKAAIKAQEQINRLVKYDKRDETKPGAFYGTLVSMHVSDTSGGKKERKYAKTKAQKRTIPPKFKKNYARKWQK